MTLTLSTPASLSTLSSLSAGRWESDKNKLQKLGYDKASHDFCRQDELISIEPDLGGSVHLDDTKKIWMPDLYVYALKKIRPGSVDCL